MSKCVRGQDVSRVFRKSRGGAASGGGRALGTKKGGIGELFTAWMQLQAMCGLAGPGWVAC